MTLSELEKSFGRIFFCALLLQCVLLFGSCAIGEDLPGRGSESKAPTCTESGYKAIEEQGTIRFEQIPPAGHRYGEWAVIDGGTARTRTCLVCGYEETIRISTVPEELLPKLEMSGSLDGIGKKSRAALKVKYTDPEQSFECYGLLTLQGHSTFGMPKKNYTIRFYDDAEGVKKHKVTFRSWGREHKYILKANYTDVSQCRNLVGAEIWADVVRARHIIPERLSALPAFGAVDGFPVAVYLNGDFFGLYTLNLHKDDDLYKMRDGQEALVICNEEKTDESLFRAPALFMPNNESDWEIEYCGTDDDSWAKDSFNGLISFVMESDDQAFYEHLKDHLDVDAAIDYLIFIWALGLEHSGAKDLVMLMYGDVWIPSAYDMDEAFGLDAAVPAFRAPEDFLPSMSDGVRYSGTGSLLWDRILNVFYASVRERYFELRSGPLSDVNLLGCVDRFYSQVPESFYDYDWYLYPGRPEFLLHMDQQIRQYIPARMALLDDLFEGGDDR